jgi:CRP/FNR family transcriptional regulator, dissimilatory nitrate respiration regulator
VESYTLRSSTQRLIGYLLQRAPDDDDANDPVEINLPTPKHVLASRLNLTPETFSRILHELSNSGLIEVHGRNITVPDLRRLRNHDL